jgi:hypothetical protein
MKVRRGLAQPRALDDTSNIRKTSQDIDNRPSINQKAKKVEVGPGEKASVVGFLRTMGRPLSMLERRAVISTSATHYREA